MEESNVNEQQSLPVLSLDLLRIALSHLENVVDLATVAQVCRDWRALVNSCDTCWKNAFMRDYSEMNATSYLELPTWRQRYLSCTLDTIRLKLREKAEQFDDLEDETAALERILNDRVLELSKIDKSLNQLRFDINEQLEKVSGSRSVHIDSAKGKTILHVAQSVVRKGTYVPSIGPLNEINARNNEHEQWKLRLTPQTSRYLVDAADTMRCMSDQIAMQHDGLRSIMDAFRLQREAAHRAREIIISLREKKACIEAILCRDTVA